MRGTAVYEGDIDLVAGQLLAHGGSPKLIQSVREASEAGIMEELEAIAIANPELRNRLVNIIQRLGPILGRSLEYINMLDTEFFEAISRGYDPLTGLPLGCPDETFDWSESMSLTNAELYQQALGIDQKLAERIIQVQRSDPRTRTEDDWQLLEDMFTLVDDLY